VVPTIDSNSPSVWFPPLHYTSPSLSPPSRMQEENQHMPILDGWARGPFGWRPAKHRPRMHEAGVGERAPAHEFRKETAVAESLERLERYLA
jgi:hypothetical protein